MKREKNTKKAAASKLLPRTGQLNPNQEKILAEIRKKSSNDRGKDLEKATGDLLDFYKMKYHRVENYRCFACGQVQNSKASAFPDFYIYYPIRLYIECKTGTGGLDSDQRQFRDDVVSMGEDYLLLRDTVDDLEVYLKNWQKKTRSEAAKKR